MVDLPAVSSLVEAAPRSSLCSPALRAVWTGARLAGPAFPVWGHGGDNLALHRAVASAVAGDVLVVDVQGVPAGHWGEVLAVAAQARNLAGLVIDGGVRDVGALAEAGFAVFAGSVSPRPTTKRHPGRLGLPVTVGGAPVARGDLVVADADGVVIVPAELAERAVRDARAREAQEDDIMAQLRAGASTLDLYALPGGDG